MVKRSDVRFGDKSTTEGGRNSGPRATETAVRGFWQGYREIMGIQAEAAE